MSIRVPAGRSRDARSRQGKSGPSGSDPVGRPGCASARGRGSEARTAHGLRSRPRAGARAPEAEQPELTSGAPLFGLRCAHAPGCQRRPSVRLRCVERSALRDAAAASQTVGPLGEACATAHATAHQRVGVGLVVGARPDRTRAVPPLGRALGGGGRVPACSGWVSGRRGWPRLSRALPRRSNPRAERPL
jgi:hypothetical protein